MLDIAWLDPEFVEMFHLELLVEHGGMHGIRDRGLLESALARPKNLLAYGEPSLAALAAAYGMGLSKNHPFVDGNKRVTLAAMACFLDINGYELVAPEAETVVVILRLASGEIDEKELINWIEGHLQPLDPDQ